MQDTHAPLPPPINAPQFFVAGASHTAPANPLAGGRGGNPPPLQELGPWFSIRASSFGPLGLASAMLILFRCHRLDIHINVNVHNTLHWGPSEGREKGGEVKGGEEGRKEAKEMGRPSGFAPAPLLPRKISYATVHQTEQNIDMTHHYTPSRHFQTTRIVTILPDYTCCHDTARLHVLSWHYQTTRVVMTLPDYTCCHDTTRLRVLSWHCQTTRIVTTPPDYTCCNDTARLHTLSWHRQITRVVMTLPDYTCCPAVFMTELMKL